MVDSSEHLLLVEQFSKAFVDELVLRRPESPIASDTWPTVGALAEHVASIYRWVAEIVSTGAASPRSEGPLVDDTMVAEVSGARERLLNTLTRAGSDSPCWIIGGHQGSAAFWIRRMVFETLKHLVDLRGAGGEPTVPAELTAVLGAQGIDEFFAVFLARSRASLNPLPGTVALVASDTDRAWSLTTDWSVGDDTHANTVVRARAADLLLLLWERADALIDPARFAVEGENATLSALQSTPIHR